MTNWWQVLVNLIHLVECKTLTTFHFIILNTVEDRPPPFVFAHALIDPLLNTPEYAEQFRRNYLPYTRNFTMNVRAHSCFCHPAILQFSITAISFVISCKELKIAQIAQINLKALLTFELKLCPR